MKTNRLAMLLISLSSFAAVSAQTSFDAAKLYEEELNGTARYVGMGGAMSALGSDASVISHNPAGIGTYRNSDFNASISFFGTSNTIDPLYDASHRGNIDGVTYYSNNSKSDLGVGFDNISFILSGNEGDDSYLNFGFSYRKLQNMDRYMDYYDKFYVDNGNDVRYREYIDHQRNKVNSFDFNLSWNFSDVFYLGWTVGILSTDTWSEGDYYDYLPSYEKAEPEDRGILSTSAGWIDTTSVDKMNTAEGSGWNMAVGMIFRPVPGLRLGVAVKTPTMFKQRLDYVDYLYAYRGESFLDGNGNPPREERSVDYKFSSPWSINLSAGLTFGKTAFGIEYEQHYTQRSSISIGNTKVNSQGAIDYQDFSTFKMGVEQNVGNFSIRAGYNYTQPMFNDRSGVYLTDTEFNDGRMDFQLDRPGKRKYYTCGLGYCSAPDSDGTQFYFDMAYVHGVRSRVFNPGEYKEDFDVNYNYKTDKVLFTVGWNF